MRMGRASAARSKRSGAPSEVAIPAKFYFRMREVSRLTQTKPYVLRFWETKFPLLRPTKMKSRHRLYRREDIRVVLAIKDLLYYQGYTIEGAQRRLSSGVKKPGVENKVSSGSKVPDLRMMKRELESILTIISRGC